MAVTGMVLAYEPQIVEWAERDRRVVSPPSADAPRLSLDELAKSAASAASGGRLSAVTVKSGPSASVSVSFGREGGSLFVNPYTGAVLGGDSRTHDFLHAVEEWHRWLGSREIGKPITGAAGLFFFFLLLSGLYLWWPRRGTRASLKTATVPSFKLKGRARDWNWHNTVGFWAAPLLLVTTSTGAIISYRWAGDLLFVLTGNEPPPRPQEGGKPAGEGRMAVQERKKESGRDHGSREKEAARGRPGREGAKGNSGETSPRASLDSLFARATAQVPTWSTISLRLPRKGGDPATASILEPGFTGRYARSQLSLDAVSAAVVRWEPYAEQNLGRRLRSWVVPLHTGRAGGPVGQFLALLSAAAAALLVWTGLAMAWRRFFKPGPRPAAVAPRTIETTLSGRSEAV
jgi:uncharacterized iron-regulated membrane protein